MIPFFTSQTIALGPLTIHVWGLFVSLGAVSALALSLYLAKIKKLKKETVWDLFLWLLIGGIFGARIFNVLFYAPTYYYANPGEALAFWHGGASSLGGFIGALAALLVYARIKKMNFKEFLLYGDIFAVALWLGWAIGRLGCFMIHDHPGRLTNFWLAVNFPAGARFDLGLLESFFSLVIFVVAIFLYRRFAHAKPGRTIFWTFIIYATGRFGLDFLRASDLTWSDPRYVYMTPVQWGILVFFILTIAVFLRRIALAWKSINK
jgi:phosphatidylglycerol:prolipoprotein diacylglycerol transferase